MEHHHGIPYLREVIVFLVAAGVMVPLFHRMRISPVLGYLVVGGAIGPFGLGLLAQTWPVLHWVVIDDLAGVQALAELGVVFLLFVIGLELSLERLWAMRRLVFGLGSLQIVVTGTIIGLVAWGFGNTVPASIVLGACLALSSTAIVMQLLMQRRRLGTPLGRSSFSILLMQDLAVVPILFVVGVLGAQMAGDAEGNLVVALALALAKAIATIAAIYVVGRVVLRPALRVAAQTRSPEMFMAAILLAVIGISAITGAAGLSMALGAFLAGLMLSETEYRHAALQAIEPFKGLLMGLFFVSVGMSLDLVTVAADALWLVGSVIGLYALKSAVLFTLFRLFGQARGDAAEAALLLGQAGEFALIVIGIALGAGLLDARTGNFMLLVTTLSMFMTPLAAKAGRALHRRFDRAADTAGEGAPARSLPAQEDVVIIAGFGRVGQRVARVLDRAGLPWVAIERHVAAATRHHSEGRPVVVGDAGSPSLLHRLGAGHARALVVTMDDPAAARHVVRSLHAEFPALPLIARARDGAHAAELRAAGASEVIPEALEAALQLGDHVLAQLDVSPARRGELIDAERRSAD